MPGFLSLLSRLLGRGVPTSSLFRLGPAVPGRRLPRPAGQTRLTYRETGPGNRVAGIRPVPGLRPVRSVDRCDGGNPTWFQDNATPVLPRLALLCALRSTPPDGPIGDASLCMSMRVRSENLRKWADRAACTGPAPGGGLGFTNQVRVDTETNNLNTLR